jgi:class 3 adenylate cyclase
MRKIQARIAVAITVSIAFGATLSVLSLSKPMETLEWKVYDGYLGLSSKRPAPSSFLIIYPRNPNNAKRRSAKDALSVLRLLEEFEVKRVALAGEAYEGGADLEELNALRAELPDLVDRESETIAKNIRSLFGAIRIGSIAPKELPRYVDNLVGIVENSGTRIKEASGQERGQTLGALKKEISRFQPDDGYFSETKADSDGILRRIPLVKADGKVIRPRIELAALITELGNPVLTLETGRIVLEGAKRPGAKARDIIIPVDSEWRCLIDWPDTDSGKEPRLLDLSVLFETINAEKEFLSALETMQTGGLLVGEGAALLSRFRNAERLGEEREIGDASAGIAWREARQDFFAAAAKYFSGQPEAEFLAVVEEKAKRGGSANEELYPVSERKEYIEGSYKAARAVLKTLIAGRSGLSTSLRASFLFISLTDDKAHLLTPNGSPTSPAAAGAAFASSVLTGRLPRRIDDGGPLTLALFLTIVAASLCLAFSPLPALGLGLGLSALGYLVSLVCFLIQGLFIPILPLLVGPTAAASLSFFLLRRLRRTEAGTLRKRVAIAAFKAPGLLRALDGLSPEAARKASTAFHEAVRDATEMHGGKIAESDGTTLLAYFEEEGAGNDFAERAIEAALSLGGTIPLPVAGQERGIEVRIGLDLGECLLQKMDLAPARRPAYALLGAAADLALRLADLNTHYETKVLATGAILENNKADFNGSAIGELEVEATKRRAALFSLKKKKDPS